MFEPKQGQIPGYTGHQRVIEEADQRYGHKEPQKQIPGYAGYIPGIDSENVFGQTYGKTSYASSANSFHRGIDEPSNLKYNTIMKKEFIDHAYQQHETTAQIVGVHREEDSYQKPIPPTTIQKFWGCNPAEGDPVVAEEQFKANQTKFFMTGEEAPIVRPPPPQTEDDAINVFYGADTNVP